MRVYVPWTVPGYFNGAHPLLAPLLEHSSPDIEWCFPSTSVDVVKKVNEWFVSNTQCLGRLSARAPDIKQDDAVSFLASRNCLVFLQQPGEYDLEFHHTTPWTNGAKPFILHIENLVTLFSPSLLHGISTHRTRLRDLPIFQFVESLLESNSCLSIFTHMRFTVAQLEQVFQNRSITDKIAYIPLGVSLPTRTLDTSAKHTVFLFTNSHHGLSPSFLVRGGVPVLEAFLEVEPQFPNVELVLYSKLPENLSSGFRQRILEHPKIKIIESHVSESEILQAFRSADVFFLPALGLHSLSVLRAMACGALCIVSDAPGYDEYVLDGYNGLVVKGIRDKVYFTDPDSGALLDNYELMYQDQPFVTTQLISLMRSFLLNPRGFDSIRVNAVQAIRERFQLSNWFGRFAELIGTTWKKHVQEHS